MSNVLLGEAFSNEYVAQMCTASGTDYLCTDSVRIRNSLHRAGNLIIETGPPTVSIEFVFRTV